MRDELARLLEAGCDVLEQAERESRRRRAWSGAEQEPEQAADVQETPGKKHGTVERGVVEKEDANGAEGEKTRKVFHRQEKIPQSFSTGEGEPVENAAERLAVEDVTAAAPLLLETRRMEEVQARVRLGGLAAEERLKAAADSVRVAHGRAAGRFGEVPLDQGEKGDWLDGSAAGWAAMGRRGAAENGPSAEELDRLLRRDSRRYDGGFFLY